MRTTLDLDEFLLEEAAKVVPTKTRTELIERGLKALIAEAARHRLAALAGKFPALKTARRRRALG